MKNSMHHRHCACKITIGMDRKNIDIDIDTVEPYNVFCFFFVFFNHTRENAEMVGEKKTMHNESSMQARVDMGER